MTEHFAYISGPMSDIPYNNFPLFDECQAFLLSKDWDSFSPADRDRAEGWEPKPDGDVSEFDRDAAMRYDFKIILERATCIVMLPDWFNSNGAKAERMVAQEIGLPVFIYSPGDEYAGPRLLTAAAWDPWNVQNIVPHAHALTIPRSATEVRSTSPSGGQKGIKPDRPDLISPIAEEEEAKVLHYGLNKYSAHNWRDGYEWSKSEAALRRHLRLWNKGEDIDPESGLPHLAHARCHTGFLLEWAVTHPEFDDRYRLR